MIKIEFCMTKQGDRFEIFILGLVGLAEDLVHVLTFGCVMPSFRAAYLFRCGDEQ